MKLRPPSPAVAISVTALVIACTGSAVAATVITSSQIRNGTIQNVDIKSSTIGLSKLSKGTQNLINAKKSPAPTGRVAYEAIRKAGPEGVPANVITRVATLTVPAGAYSVQANMVMTAFAGKTNPLSAAAGRQRLARRHLHAERRRPDALVDGHDHRQRPPDPDHAVDAADPHGRRADGLRPGLLGQRAVACLGDLDHRDVGRQRLAEGSRRLS